MNVKEFMETQKNSNEIEKEVYESHNASKLSSLTNQQKFEVLQ